MEKFVPDLNRERERLEVVEHALGDGGIIDAHLRWVDIETQKGKERAPSADLTNVEYGYVPKSFNPEITEMGEPRPGREPFDFTDITTSMLSLPYDAPYEQLVGEIKRADRGWYAYLHDQQVVDKPTLEAMITAGFRAYRLHMLTEDNLPAYVATSYGDSKALAQSLGMEIPATEEWSRGIWTAEEDNHKLSMNEYGKIMSITNTREHAAGRTSQLRAGMEVQLDHVIQLFTYVAWQELSTNIAHKNDGELFGPIGHELLSNRVAADEARHHWVYMSVLKELANAFPDDTVRTVHTVLSSPFMPGSKGIPNYSREALRIHKSNIFSTEHAFQAAKTVIQKLGYLSDNPSTEGLSGEGIVALEQLRANFGEEPARRRGKPAAFVLEHTITARELSVHRKNYAVSAGVIA